MLMLRESCEKKKGMDIKKNYRSPRVIDRGTLAHFCVSDQYLIIKLMRTNKQNILLTLP